MPDEGKQLQADLTAEPRRRRARLGLTSHDAQTLERASPRQTYLRLSDSFFALAAHELRTPVQALNLHVQASLMQAHRMRDQLVPLPWVAAVLGKADRLLARLRRMMEEVLSVAEIDRGHVDLDIEQVDLAEVVHDVVERCRDELRWANCTVTTAEHGNLRGSWDRLRLDIIFTNLLANAMKYGSNKPIEVLLEADASTVTLRICDHGIGIAEGDHTRIFERFERINRDQEANGFGLGLWVAKTLVEALGGQLSVDSSLGRGAVFTVTLPRSSM